MSSKAAVLERVREALADGRRDDMPSQWVFGLPNPSTGGDRAAVVDLFVERVEDYRAAVVRATSAQLPQAIVAALQACGVTSVVLPSGLDEGWVGAIEASGIVNRCDDPPLERVALYSIDAVVTASSGGFAETGTILLTHGPDQGRRALSLVPDTHVCVVKASQIATDVCDGMPVIADALRRGQPTTWISGPSATSDIELSRVEGVHGPRTLSVIVVTDA